MPPGFYFKQLCIATPLKYLPEYPKFSVYHIMPYYQTWEEFARAAEKLYLTDPMKVIDKQPLVLFSGYRLQAHILHS